MQNGTQTIRKTKKKMRDEHLQQAYDRIAAALPDDQISELKIYANLFFETEAENEAFLPPWA